MVVIYSHNKLFYETCSILQFVAEKKSKRVLCYYYRFYNTKSIVYMYLKYTPIVPTVSCIEIFILLIMYKCYNDSVVCTTRVEKNALV